MAANEQLEDTPHYVDDESPSDKTTKEQKLLDRENSEERQRKQDTPATKQKEDAELEEGELIDDDDDDDDDDGCETDGLVPSSGQIIDRDGLANLGSGSAGPNNVGAKNIGPGNVGSVNMGPGVPGPGGAGPARKYNTRCKYYSRRVNHCLWGAECRFEHRDSPEPGEAFDHRGQPPPGPPHSALPIRRPAGPTLLPMVPAERPYPPYANRSQPYPMVPHGYGPYDPYGQQPLPHHQSPPLPPHFMQPHHWPQQQGLLYHPSPPGHGHLPFESVSPSHPSTNVVGPSSHGSSVQPNAGPASAPPPPAGGTQSPGYPPSSSPASSAVYERKHRLAYELAPWNDRGGGYPTNKYDRGDPGADSGYPSGPRGALYRNHYNRDPYGRDHPGPPPYYMAGGPPHSSYPPGYPSNYPSSYSSRGGPMGPHPSHYKYMSSSHRTMPPEGGRSRSSKRGHEEDESSWSDSGSEDSILGQASYNNKSHSSKSNKKPHHQHMQAEHTNHHSSQRQQETPTKALSSDDTNLNNYQLDQGSGTPPGEPLPEDKERQEKLLNKLKEIEDMMAKKKEQQEQDDSVIVVSATAPCNDIVVSRGSRSNNTSGRSHI